MWRGMKRDRRQGYSITGHVRRVLATKGIVRVGMSLGATALVAAIAFAHCSSSSITGPGTTQSAPTGNNGGDNTDHAKDVLAPPAKFGPIRVPMTVLPQQSPCTGQPIVWDPTQSFTMMQGTSQTALDGAAHFQYHMNTQAQGVTNIPLAAYRQYVGSEEYDSQDMVFSDQNQRYKLEWNVKMIAKGEDGAIHDEDDFFIHVIMNTPFDPLQADVTTYGQCK
jgi:hypothetical protein